jgi:hypothetical protein
MAAMADTAAAMGEAAKVVATAEAERAAERAAAEAAAARAEAARAAARVEAAREAEWGGAMVAVATAVATVRSARLRNPEGQGSGRMSTDACSTCLPA